MHFLGLLSDGNVHSHINHLKALIAQAKKEGVKRVRLHILLDGRDVPETSALKYVDEIESFMNDLERCRLRRSDRFRRRTHENHDGSVTKPTGQWLKKAGRFTCAALDAISNPQPKPLKRTVQKPASLTRTCQALSLSMKTAIRKERSMTTIPLILFNFRGDRAQEISIAFDADDIVRQVRSRKSS